MEWCTECGEKSRDLDGRPRWYSNISSGETVVFPVAIDTSRSSRIKLLKLVECDDTV